MARCSDTCSCRNLVCAITFLVIGIAFVVAGGVIAAVGFGTRPKDMFDTPNLSMRVVGLILVGAGILPIIMGAMFAFFYCGHRSGKFVGRKKEIKNDVEMNVISKGNPAWNEYPYPSEGGSLIYKSGPPPDDSLVKYEDYGKDDSFNVPLNRSEKSFNNGGADTSNIYAEVKPSEMAGVKTRTTTSTTYTKVYQTGKFEGTSGSVSSAATSHNENGPQVKAKHPKKQMVDSISPSISSGIPSFNDGDVPPQPKAKRPKKHKKKDRSGGEEDFDGTDEPLPGGKYRSDGSDSTDARKPVPKPRRSAGSPSFEDEDDTPPAPVYGRVHKKHEKNLY